MSHLLDFPGKTRPVVHYIEISPEAEKVREGLIF